MVEWGCQQAPRVLHMQQANHVTNSTNATSSFGLESIAEEWLTADISSLEQEANSLCNSVLNPSDVEVNNMLDETCNSKTVALELQLLKKKTALQTLKSDSTNTFSLCDSCDMWDLEFENQQLSKFKCHENLDNFVEAKFPVPASVWNTPLDLDSLQMDDVFQVDKADLIQGPTLAELNANGESLFDSLDSYDLLLPSTDKEAHIPPNQSKIQTLSASTMPSDVGSIYSSNLKSAQVDLLSLPKKFQEKDAGEQNIDSSPVVTNSLVVGLKEDTNINQKPVLNQASVTDNSTLVPPEEAKLQTVPVASKNKSPLYLTTTSPIKRIENDSDKELQEKQLISLDKEGSVSDEVMCTLSADEGFDSQAENSDHEDFLSSDDEIISGEDSEKMHFTPHWSMTSSRWSGSRRKHRFFWQYNIQSRGPKGSQLSLNSDLSDPYILNDITDPVFSSSCHVQGVKHAGKARRGDGNDLTPNPHKLYSIGLELKKLSKIINDLKPVNELPSMARPKSRKEKNKLASRACRLKKKAQHEANKLKLFGLQQEHKQLINMIHDAKQFIEEKIDGSEKSKSESCLQKMLTLIKRREPLKVAGHTSEFVNKVLDKVAAGDLSGGLKKMN